MRDLGMHTDNMEGSEKPYNSDYFKTLGVYEASRARKSNAVFRHKPSRSTRFILEFDDR